MNLDKEIKEIGQNISKLELDIMAILTNGALAPAMRNEKYRRYYAGGTLMIDITKEIMVFVNISSETYTVIYKGDTIHMRLMSIREVSLAYEIYLETKGGTSYFHECFDNSCLKPMYEIQTLIESLKQAS